MISKIRLLVADDHAILRDGLKAIFAQTPDLRVAAEAADSGEVLSCIRHGGIDLLLLDTSMPGIGGEDLIYRLRAHHPELPILVLGCCNSDPQLARRVLRSGASGYITKTCGAEALLSAIRRVAAGGRFIDPALAEQIAFEVSLGGHSGQLHESLSDREFQVLRLLAGGHSVNAVAALLAINNRTVSTHKARLMEKMGFSNNAELVRYAVEHHLID